MTELDVALTDFLLAIECAAFAALLHLRRPRGTALLRSFSVLFLSLAAASLFGGIWHGFFLQAETTAGRLIWFCAQIFLGVAAFMLWMVSAALTPDRRWQKVQKVAATVQLGAYGWATIFLTDSFTLSAANMAPSSALLCGLLLRSYFQTRQAGLLLGAFGLAVALLAGVVPWARLSLPLAPLAVFHLTELVAFFLVFASIPAIVARAGPQVPNSRS